MAILSKTGITTGQTVETWHVTQSIDAFTGAEAYDITLSGSLDVTGSLGVTGSINVNGVGATFTGTTSVTLNSPSVTITDNTNQTVLSLQSVFTDDTLIEAGIGSKINFSNAGGSGDVGYFRIPTERTGDPTPRAGVMYWDDGNSLLYIYSETVGDWVSASFV